MSIKSFFGKKKWNTVKTSKAFMFLSFGMVIIYAVILIVLTSMGKHTDRLDVLTEEFIGYAKWIVGGSAGIGGLGKVISYFENKSGGHKYDKDHEPDGKDV